MNWFGQTAPVRREAMSGNPLVVGLVNNTSDRGLQATERQFVNLLRAAAPQLELHVKLFTCPGVARSCRTPDGAHGRYAEIDELFDTRLDALIVTGMEPQAAMLQDEPVWPQPVPAGGLGGRPGDPDDLVLPGRACRGAAPGRDLQDPRRREAVRDLCMRGGLRSSPAGRASGALGQSAFPLQRLAELALRGHGYAILSRSDEAGADIFLRSGNAPFVFFQGHPEYEPNTLLHEYKRDVRRYLTGERDTYPAMPIKLLRWQHRGGSLSDPPADPGRQTRCIDDDRTLQPGERACVSEPVAERGDRFRCDWLASVTVTAGAMPSCRVAAECSL